MSAKNKVIDEEFADILVVLLIADTQVDGWSDHLRWNHPPDTQMIYLQACQALSNRVRVVSVDKLLDEGFAKTIHGQKGLFVDIVGGLFNIELIGLPSSISHFMRFSCFPASIKNYVTSHDKLLGKYLAQNCGLKTANTISGVDLNHFKGATIEKPICGGDSVGIEFKRQWSGEPRIGCFVEEFIQGKDSTVHVLRNRDKASYSIVDHLIASGAEYEWLDMNTKGNANRIFSLDERVNRTRYKGGISKPLSDSLGKLLEECGYPFIGRVDFRQTKQEGEVGIEEMTFLELNVAPTISNANNWYDGVKSIFGNESSFKIADEMPIHPAAKSLCVLLREYYAQSLSMHGNKAVLL